MSCLALHITLRPPSPRKIEDTGGQEADEKREHENPDYGIAGNGNAIPLTLHEVTEGTYSDVLVKEDENDRPGTNRR